MIQRCKKLTGHIFTVVLVSVLLAGFGGEAYGSGDDDHKKKKHHKEVRLQGNVNNINAKKTKFELCTATECTKIKVTRRTSFMDINGRASELANLEEDDYVTVVGRVRNKHHDKKHHDKRKRHHDEDFSPRATVKAKTVEIGIKTRYLILNGTLNNINSVDRTFDVVVVDTATRTLTTTPVTVPQNAEVLLVNSTGGTTPVLIGRLLAYQMVEVHGHYNNTGILVAQTVLATAF